MERFVFHVTADNEFRIVDTSDDGKNYLFDDVDTILKLLNDAQATIAALQARVRELEARCQRAPLDHETVCHACDGSGWVERGY